MKTKERPAKERQVHSSAHGSRIHDKGAKADRDRSVVLRSYLAMCDEFRVPRRMRLTPREIASMTNTQLYQASKDLYNNASVKQAQRLAVRLGVTEKPPAEETFVMPTWLRRWLRKITAARRASKLLQRPIGTMPPAPQPPARSDLVLVKPEAVNA